MIKGCLKKLCANEIVSVDELISSFDLCISGNASPASVGSFLTALNFRKDALSALFLSRAASLLSSKSEPFPLKHDVVLDIVGTGGDGHDTFNVSTAASILCRAALPPDIAVAKHGNRSSSGKCGSGDFVEALGFDLSCEGSAKQMSETGYAFLFAPAFHPSMKGVSGVRKDLGFRTVFNLLGPLINPARPTHLVLGVGSRDLVELYAETVCKLDFVKKAVLVHSAEGMDEFSPAGPSSVWFVEEGKVSEEVVVCPKDFGLECHSIEEVQGGSPRENSEAFREIVRGKGKKAHVDFILMQASAALVILGEAKNWKDGCEKARSALQKISQTFPSHF